MPSIKLRSHVGTDGIMHLDVPVGVQDTELEVTVSFLPVSASSEVDTPPGKGWSPGFFAETFGSFSDEPLVIDSEGIVEEQD